MLYDICMCMCMCRCRCRCRCSCVYVYAYAYAYVCMCMYICIWLCIPIVCTCIYIYITYECTTGKPPFLDGKQPRGGFIYRFSLSAPVTHGSHGQVNLSNAAGTRCYWPTDASTTGSMPPSTGSKELGRIWRFP